MDAEGIKKGGSCNWIYQLEKWHGTKLKQRGQGRWGHRWARCVEEITGHIGDDVRISVLNQHERRWRLLCLCWKRQKRRQVPWGHLLSLLQRGHGDATETRAVCNGPTWVPLCTRCRPQSALLWRWPTAYILSPFSWLRAGLLTRPVVNNEPDVQVGPWRDRYLFVSLHDYWCLLYLGFAAAAT